ncbi:hypothetical protein [Limnoglobus roseus]|nr:hypothetical protein [Limnoglobus roseus]
MREPVQPPPAPQCDGRASDSFGFASPTAGPPFRVLFCTWLN